MKKLILIFVMCLVFPFYSLAAEPTFSQSPGEQTSSALIHTGRCALTGILVITDGTNDATVIIYDSTAASGTVKYESTVVGVEHYGGRSWTFPLMMHLGIYITVSGTDASYIPEYIVLP